MKRKNSSELTDQEKQFIRENAGILTSHQMGEVLNRPRPTIISFGHRDGLKLAMKRFVTDADRVFIVENAGKIKTADVAEKLGLHYVTVMRIAREEGVNYKIRPYKHLSEDEKDFIFENAGKMSYKKIADAIGRSYGAVQGFVKANFDPDYLEKMKNAR